MKKTNRWLIPAFGALALFVVGCAEQGDCRRCDPCAAVLATPPAAAPADVAAAEMFRTTDKGQGEKLGTVTFVDTPEGLDIRVDLTGLPAGGHGFHVHEKADCSPMEQDGKMGHALAAGGHYDPEKTGKHLGPDGGGHKGDLPLLTVGEGGAVKTTLRLKNAKVADFRNRSLMIHAGGDNYSDTPTALGGGGARIACGIIR